MSTRQLVEARQIFVTNYLRQMSALGDRLKMLIKHDNIVNRVFLRFIQSDDIDHNTKVYFKRFDISKQILRSPDLLGDPNFINNFLEICPNGFWRENLKTEFILYSQEPNNLDILREFRDISFNRVILTMGYTLFCNEIAFVSNRIIKFLNEIYTSINHYDIDDQ